MKERQGGAGVSLAVTGRARPERSEGMPAPQEAGRQRYAEVPYTRKRRQMK
jgi:hypothetical protein